MEGMKDLELIRELGAGNFGKVRLVKYKDKQYALKCVPLSKLSQKDKENALNEVRLLASIHLPNVISYHGAFFDDDSKSLCLLLEYADGGDLQQLILQKDNLENEEGDGLDEIVVIKIAYQILIGLKVLHKNNIIHRDLKTANIFFSNGVAKIADLNVSKFTESGLCSTHTGTPYYISPQIWKGESYTSKCDIWSLGCVIYEMCALKQPFKASDIPSLYRKVTTGIYPDISAKYSAKIKALINMCLTLDEEIRPNANQILDLPIFKNVENIISRLENVQVGEVKMLNTIKCPKVLKLLNSRLPQLNNVMTPKKTVNFKIKKEDEKKRSGKENSMKKVRSQKSSSKINEQSKKKSSDSKMKKTFQGKQKSPDLSKNFSLKKFKKASSTKNLHNNSGKFQILKKSTFL